MKEGFNWKSVNLNIGINGRNYTIWQMSIVLFIKCRKIKLIIKFIGRAKQPSPIM
jgi:hypothetical protein